MPTETRTANNVLRHDNHTAPASLTQRTFSVLANSLVIYNSNTTLTANVSFDGTNTFPIPPEAQVSFDVSQLKSYWTSETTGVAALKVLFGSEI